MTDRVYQVLLTGGAEDDLESIYDYIAQYDCKANPWIPVKDATCMTRKHRANAQCGWLGLHSDSEQYVPTDADFNELEPRDAQSAAMKSMCRRWAKRAWMRCAKSTACRSRAAI